MIGMTFFSGFKYALEILWESNFILLRVVVVATIIEYLFKVPIFIKRLRMPKPTRLIGAGTRVFSFFYFLFCFLYLINDAYIDHHAPADFYYIQWWVLIYPLTMGLQRLLYAIEWKGDGTTEQSTT